MLQFILDSKPVLVGLHLGFAILGIDLLLWHLGELAASVRTNKRMKWISGLSAASFLMSWIFGGYYYVNYYGSLVKPIILKGTVPWAHTVSMEAKEHIFLFILPMVLTVFLMSEIFIDELKSLDLKRPLIFLLSLIVGLALLMGLMGFVISAAARWA